MRSEAERHEVCEKFRQYVLSSPELMASLHELKGLTLACWCGEEQECHVKVIVDLYRQFVGDPEE
jgi:hypothetical protein